MDLVSSRYLFPVVVGQPVERRFVSCCPSRDRRDPQTTTRPTLEQPGAPPRDWIRQRRHERQAVPHLFSPFSSSQSRILLISSRPHLAPPDAVDLLRSYASVRAHRGRERSPVRGARGSHAHAPSGDVHSHGLIRSPWHGRYGSTSSTSAFPVFESSPLENNLKLLIPVFEDGDAPCGVCRGRGMGYSVGTPAWWIVQGEEEGVHAAVRYIPSIAQGLAAAAERTTPCTILELLPVRPAREEGDSEVALRSTV